MKISCRVFGLFLFTAGLINILLPQPAIAQEAKIDLILRLVGDYNYEVNAGKDNAFYLEIRNNGNQTVTNLRLSADKPEDWVIEFRPGVINYLGAGSVQTVDVNIKPSEKATKGEYKVIFIAEANEIRRVENFWMRVVATSYWPWIGAILASVVVALFVFIFLRYGRR